MRYTVDRIESGFAVCEDENGRFCDIPLENLPKVRSGDVLDESGGRIFVNDKATEERRKKIIQLQNELWK